MKTKIYIVLLFGLFSIKSNAQEQFLKFDSIQVIQGEHLATPYSNTFSIHDTVTCPVGGLIKVQNVVLDVESTYSYFSNSPINNYRCKINGIGIASIKSANNSNGNKSSDIQSTPTSYESVTETGLFYKSNINFNLYGDYYAGGYSSQFSIYFRYRIELHHYSYE